MKKVIRLTENDLTRIVKRVIKEHNQDSNKKKKGIKEQQEFEGSKRSIMFNDVYTAIEDALESNDIDPELYDDEIFKVANRIMDGFESELAYIDETTLFMDLLDDLSNREDENNEF
jgi:hypothetical protein